MRRSSAIVMGLLLTSTTSLISINAVADLKIIGGGSAEVGFVKPISSWKTKEVLTKSGRVGYCAMVNHYEKGVMFAVAKNPKGSGSIALDFQNNMFDAGREYSVALGVDNRFSKKLMGKANSENSLIIQYGQDSELYNALQKGKRLDVVLPENGISFDLTGYNNGLNKLDNCLLGGKEVTQEVKLSPAETMPKVAPKEVVIRRQKAMPSANVMDMDNSVIRSAPTAATGVVTKVIELGKKAPVIASAPVVAPIPALPNPVKIFDQNVLKKYGAASPAPAPRVVQIPKVNKVEVAKIIEKKEPVISNVVPKTYQETAPYVREKNGFAGMGKINKVSNPVDNKKEFSWEDRAKSIKNTRSLLDGLNISRLKNDVELEPALNTEAITNVEMPIVAMETPKPVTVKTPELVVAPKTAIVNLPQPVTTRIYDNRQEFSISDESIANNIPELSGASKVIDGFVNNSPADAAMKTSMNDMVVEPMEDTVSENRSLSTSLTNVPIAVMQREISQKQADLSRQSQANVEQAEWLEIEKSKIERMRNSVSEDYSGPSYYSGSKALEKPASEAVYDLPNPNLEAVELKAEPIIATDIEWSKPEISKETIVSKPVVVSVPENALDNKIQEMKTASKPVILDEPIIPNTLTADIPVLTTPVVPAPAVSRPVVAASDSSLKSNDGIYQAWRSGNSLNKNDIVEDIVSAPKSIVADEIMVSEPIPAMISPERPIISEPVETKLEVKEEVAIGKVAVLENIAKVQKPNVMVDTSMVIPNSNGADIYKLDDMQDDSGLKDGNLIISQDEQINTQPVQIYNIPEKNVTIRREDRYVGQVAEVSKPETAFVEDEFARLSSPMEAIPTRTVEIRRGVNLNDAIPTPGRIVSRVDGYLNKGKQIVLPIADDINQGSGYYKPLPHEKVKVEEKRFDDYIPKKSSPVNDADLDDTMDFLDGVMKHHKLKRSAK